MDLDEVKLYLRIDTDDEDQLILDLVSAAENYLLNSGIYPDYGNSLYKSAVKMLVSDFYDGRGINGTMGVMFKSIITQLSSAQEV